MHPQKALQSLRENPRYFLKYYPLSVAGATEHHAPNARNPFNFVWYKRTSAVAGGKESHEGATRPVRFLPKATVNISSFRIGRIQLDANTENHHFQALSVPMVYYDTITTPPGGINTMDAYLLDNGGAEDVMITGQLSNCCFCITPYAGGLACVHVNQRGHPSAALGLQNTLSHNGQFANFPGALTLFGRHNYPMQATVIGVRGAAGWEIFAQFSSDSHKTLSLGSVQIYPGPTTPL